MSDHRPTAAVIGAGIACEVVPGVTAAVAAAAGTLRPLTRRSSGRSVSLATAMTRTGDLHATRTADTEIYYMAGRQLASLALRLAERMEVGMVGVNRGLVSDPAAPFGGVKASGLGRELGPEGLAAYTELQTIYR